MSKPQPHPEGSPNAVRVYEGVIDMDLACADCGYNLRGLKANGRCPECNYSIARSRNLFSNTAKFSSLRKFRRGAQMMCLGLFFTSLLGIYGVLLTAEHPLYDFLTESVLLMAIAASSISYLAGAYLISSSSNDPYYRLHNLHILFKCAIVADTLMIVISFVVYREILTAYQHLIPPWCKTPEFIIAALVSPVVIWVATQILSCVMCMKLREKRLAWQGITAAVTVFISPFCLFFAIAYSNEMLLGLTAATLSIGSLLSLFYFILVVNHVNRLIRMSSRWH